MEWKKFDMPNNLKARVNKRMTCFMEHLSKKKHKSRVDVYMEHLKLISSKEIYDIDDKDVLKFFIFKDVNDSGRTIVHKNTCLLWGNLLWMHVLMIYSVA